jgi:hypothetical protein
MESYNESWNSGPKVRKEFFSQGNAYNARNNSFPQSSVIPREDLCEYGSRETSECVWNKKEQQTFYDDPYTTLTIPTTNTPKPPHNTHTF